MPTDAVLTNLEFRLEEAERLVAELWTHADIGLEPRAVSILKRMRALRESLELLPPREPVPSEPTRKRLQAVMTLIEDEIATRRCRA